MVEQNRFPRSRAHRGGRTDGTSHKAHFVARWVDEDTGAHEVTLSADSAQDARDLLDPYVQSNTLTVHRVGT